MQNRPFTTLANTEIIMLYTHEAEESFKKAEEAAKELCCDFIGTDHLLLGILACESEGKALLVELRIDPAIIKASILALVSSGHDGYKPPPAFPKTPRLKKILEYAEEERKQRNAQEISTVDMLIACAREEEGVAAVALRNIGGNLLLEKLRTARKS